jgi:hypothetical protein
MADEGMRDAQRRWFIVLANVQKSEDVTLDGRDPAFRALCDSPELPSMTEEEMRRRALELVKLATEFPC